MFIIKWEGKYILTKQDKMNPKELHRLLSKWSWATVELTVLKDTYYVFERQNWTFKPSKNSSVDIIDFNELG